jgi:hypothetical protein
MNKAEHLKPWMWRPGRSGNPSGSKPKPRRSFDAVRRFEALGIDPLEEVIALAQDPALPKPLRLKTWMALCEFAYPRLAPIMPHETVSTTLEELQRSWDAIELDELKETFLRELSTLPADIRSELEELVAKNGFSPLIMRRLLKFKFVEQRTESQAQDPQQPGLKVVKT